MDYSNIKNNKIYQLAIRCLRKIKKRILDQKWYDEEKKVRKLARQAGKKIYYFGMCENTNMGDMAQIYCVENWIKNSYPDYLLISCHTATLMLSKSTLLKDIKKYITKEDFIIFQCGYNTHDLGGHQDEMHQMVMKEFPDNIMIMLPQTVYFKSQERKDKCSKSYNAHQKLFFMARDPISLKLAKEMFPNVTSVMYPDIVASLIGKFYKDEPRDGICLCMRNDVEQFYDAEDRKELFNSLKKFDKVTLMDTVIPVSFSKVNKNIEKYVWGIIEFFGKKRLVVTDKYHGTIFSLVSNTPVIMIKTTDHKLTSVYEWFKSVYPDRIYFAKDINEVSSLAEEILKNPNYSKLSTYFYDTYYKNLTKEIEKWKSSF